jgi:hypothetical protein
MFLSVAHGGSPPPPPPELGGAPVLHVRDAIEAVLDAITQAETHVADVSGVRSTAVTPCGSVVDLFAAVARVTTVGPRLHDTNDSLAAAVAETIAGYRHAARPADRAVPPTPKAAA